MTFQDDNGNAIEVPGSFAMTKQGFSFFNFLIKGDVSINFQVDNNSANRKTLGYYGPQMNSQVAFTKQPFNRMRDGNVLDRGYIVIQDEYPDYLDCFYVSGNSGWIQILTTKITSLDFSSYAVLYNEANYQSRISATSGIIFPLVDWLYDLKKGKVDYDLLYINAANGTALVDDSYNVDDNITWDFYPSFYLSTLVNEIGIQSGIKITGSVLNDGLYKSLIIPPISGRMKRNPFANVSLSGSSFTAGVTGFQKYDKFSEISDADNIFLSNRLTLTKKTGLYVTITARTSVATLTGLVVYVYKNGALFTSTQTLVTNQPSKILPIITGVPGDFFEIYVNMTIGNSITLDCIFEFPSVIQAGDYVEPSNFLPELTCIDIIKFIASFFGCSCYFNTYTKTLTMNIIETLRPEDSLNWSEYHVSHRNEYTVNWGTNNYFRFADNTDDSYIVKYNVKKTVRYGEGNITTGNTLKTDNELVKLPFAASSIALEKNGVWMTNVPLVSFSDDGTPFAFSGILDGGTPPSEVALTVADATLFKSGEVIRVTNSSGASLGYFRVIPSDATHIVINMLFYGNDTGIIYKQKIDFNTITPRILSVKPSTNYSDISSISSYSIFSTDSGTVSGLSTVAYAIFTKPPTTKSIDFWKSNLAFDNLAGYIDPTIKELYYNKISSFINNPSIRTQMLLPENVFQAFDFSTLIYLNTENLNGYFFVDSITNYQDSVTPVEVNLYML